MSRLREAGTRASDLGQGLLRLQLLREHTLLALFSLVYLVAFGVYGLVTESPAVLLYLVLMSLAMLFVAVLYRRVRFGTGVLWGLAIWGLLHMAGGLVQLDDEVLYHFFLVGRLVRFDHVVHAFGFGFGTLAAWQAMRLWIDEDRRMTAGLAVLIALAGMGIGAVNEVFEFGVSQLNPDSNVGGYLNTGWDLVYNTLGCSLAALYVFRRDRTVRSSEPTS